MNKLLIILGLTSLSLLSGCASMIKGTKQSMSVNTGSTQHATCSLKNDKGTWYISDTPGSATIHKSAKDLQVICKKKNYAAANQAVKSKTKGATFGYLLVGGLIGASIDAASGAAYDYPTDINVPMHKRGRA